MFIDRKNDMLQETMWFNTRKETGQFQTDSVPRLPFPLHWRLNALDGASNYWRHDYLPNRLFTRRSRRTSKLRATVLCEGNSPITGKFPAQRASNAENVSMWWRHHEGLVSQTIGERHIWDPVKILLNYIYIMIFILMESVQLFGRCIMQ